MSKVAVVYYSSTGNTEMMAEQVAEGARLAGADVSVFRSSDFNESMLDDYDAIAFGCAAYGAEQLDDTEFEPMFLACEPHLSNRKLGLFGSYDWGDGEWMRIWVETCTNAGAQLVNEGVIANLTPDDEALEACRDLGKLLA